MSIRLFVLIMPYNSSMATPNVFQVPPVNKRKRIPMRTIHAIAMHIAENFNPEKIILFGSHAYGKPDAWSDVDLAVVSAELAEEAFEAASRIRKFARSKLGLK